MQSSVESSNSKKLKANLGSTKLLGYQQQKIFAYATEVGLAIGRTRPTSSATKQWRVILR